MLVLLLFCCSLTAVTCDRTCGSDTCQEDDDYCYKIYPGNEHSCFGYIANQYRPTCGKDIINNCKFVEKSHKKFKGVFHESVAGAAHNKLIGADYNMCCCKGNDCINDGKYDPKANWLDRYCKKCSTSNKWDEEKQRYRDVNINYQCVLDEQKDKPRWCFDLFVPERKVLDKNGQEVSLPSYHELNCEYKLQHAAHSVHYLNLAKSECSALHKKGQKCGDITVIVKEANGMKDVQSPATLCCCDAYKQEQGAECNQALKTYETNDCKRKRYSEDGKKKETSKTTKVTTPTTTSTKPTTTKPKTASTTKALTTTAKATTSAKKLTTTVKPSPTTTKSASTVAPSKPTTKATPVSESSTTTIKAAAADDRAQKKSDQCSPITIKSIPDEKASKYATYSNWPTVTTTGTSAQIMCNGKKIGSFKCKDSKWVEDFDCKGDDCFYYLEAESKSYYKAIPKPFTFAGAEKECSKQCSRLAKIRSHSENSYAVGLAAHHAKVKRPDTFNHYNTKSHDRFWIGLKRIAGGGKGPKAKLQWLDGEKLEYDKSFWLTTEEGKEPVCDSCKKSCDCEDCVLLYDFGPNRWNDFPCHKRAGAICQIEVEY